MAPITTDDLSLPFSSRIAPFTFNFLAEGIHWFMSKYGAPTFFHYPDLWRLRVSF